MEREEYARAYTRKCVSHTLHALAFTSVAVKRAILDEEAASAMAAAELAFQQSRKRPRRPSSARSMAKRGTSVPGIGHLDEEGNVVMEEEENAPEMSAMAAPKVQEFDEEEELVAFQAVDDTALDVLTDLYQSCRTFGLDHTAIQKGLTQE